MKWIARRKLNKIAKVAGLVALVLSVVMGIFTFFGANGNNFVVQFKPENGISLGLYDNDEMVNSTSRLNFPSVLDQDNITLNNIPENIEEGIGSKNENVRRGYTALSFYLRNDSNVPVNIMMNIEMSKIYKNVDSAIRVMLIIDGERKIYAKAQEEGEMIGHPEVHPYTTTPFLSSVKVCENKFESIKEGQVFKITIVIWLEGNDAQCVDNIKGGSMVLGMNMWIV